MKEILSWQIFRIGDRLILEEELTNFNDKVVPSIFTSQNDKIKFLYFFKRACPHLAHLNKEINSSIENNLVNSNDVISINFDYKLDNNTKKSIQDQLKFNCYFIDEPSFNFKYRLGISAVPYGIIIKDGKIFKIPAEFSEYIKILETQE